MPTYCDTIKIVQTIGSSNPFYTAVKFGHLNNAKKVGFEQQK
jgi:hypothetical protein